MEFTATECGFRNGLGGASNAGSGKEYHYVLFGRENNRQQAGTGEVYFEFDDRINGSVNCMARVEIQIGAVEFVLKDGRTVRVRRQMSDAQWSFFLHGIRDAFAREICSTDLIPMESAPTALSGIYHFRALGDRLGTAGQPTETQFQSVREAGFDAVINLALPTSDKALANEGSIVTALGMSYVHIPVDFKAPTTQDFRAFCRVMDAFNDRRVFVHCAANMRVSAFVFLYRVLHQRATISEAELDLQAIWQPDGVWSRFIREQLEGA